MSFPKSVQAGKPKLIDVPSGWVQAPLSDYLHEVRRPAKLENDKLYSLVKVKRARGGVVKRENLTGKEVLTKTQFYVEEGDFLVSKRQIVHGACGLVPEELSGSVISNEYAIFHCNDDFDLEYLNCLSHSVYFQQTCFHSSIGVHVEKLIFKVPEWLKWKFNVPPVSEQRRIAKILSTWDKAIGTTEGLIENAKAQKIALMQQLLTGKRRFPEFEADKWREFKMSDLYNFKKGSGLSKKLVVESGQSPCILYGQLFTTYSEVITEITSFTNSDQGVFSRKNDILIPCSTTTSGVDLATASVCPTDNVRLGGDINILREKKQGRVCPKFMAFYLKSVKKYEIARLAQGITIIHLYGQHLKNIEVFLPSIEGQIRIAKVIEESGKEISKLQSQLTSLQEQKKALMQQLLTGKRRVKIDGIV